MTDLKQPIYQLVLLWGGVICGYTGKFVDPNFLELHLEYTLPRLVVGYVNGGGDFKYVPVQFGSKGLMEE